MSRYIDGDALKRKAQKVGTEAWKMKLTAPIETTLNQFIDWIDEAPTIEPKRGEWIVTDEDSWTNGTHALICSECGKGYHLNFERVIGDWNFCPNCGAQMKGADDE